MKRVPDTEVRGQIDRSPLIVIDTSHRNRYVTTSRVIEPRQEMRDIQRHSKGVQCKALASFPHDTSSDWKARLMDGEIGAEGVSAMRTARLSVAADLQMSLHTRRIKSSFVR